MTLLALSNRTVAPYNKQISFDKTAPTQDLGKNCAMACAEVPNVNLSYVSPNNKICGCYQVPNENGCIIWNPAIASNTTYMKPTLKKGTPLCNK